MGAVPADGLLGRGGGEPIGQNWLVPGSNPSFFFYSQLLVTRSYVLNISTRRQSNHLQVGVFACKRSVFIYGSIDRRKFHYRRHCYIGLL